MKTWKFLFSEWKNNAKEHPEFAIGLPIIGALLITFMILTGFDRTNCQLESNGTEIVFFINE